MSRRGYSDLVRQTRRGRAASDSNLIPMINIVFLLLIFFMVAGQVQPQDGNGIRPPVADSAVGGMPVIVDIQLTHLNEIHFDGKPLSLMQLQEALTDDRDGDFEQLLIKADRGVSAQELGAVLDVIRMSGRSNVRLMTVQSGS